MVKHYYSPDDREADGVSVVESLSVTAQNSFTEWTEFDYRKPANLSVGGSGWSATVTLQRSFDGGVTALDVWTTDEPAEKGVSTGIEPGVLWRVGVKTGDFGSGTVPVRLSQ